MDAASASSSFTCDAEDLPLRLQFYDDEDHQDHQAPPDRVPLLLPIKIMDAADEKGETPQISEDTAHQISVDPLVSSWLHPHNWGQQCICSRILWINYVPLGWIGGTCGLLLAAAISMYANALLARLHEVGGKRHIRYRDLAGHIYGRKIYGLTWALQYINLFMINTGFIILAGQALKATYGLFSDAGVLKLPYCIAISGFICALFAFGIPYLSALRIWLGFSTLFSLIYIVIAFVLSLRDGITSPARDYSIPKSSHSTRIFTTILPPSQKECRYGMRVRETFSTLTRFIANMCNIYIFK